MEARRSFAFVTIRIEDNGGNLRPTVARKVVFAVTGAERLARSLAPNPATVDPFRANPRTTINNRRPALRGHPDRRDFPQIDEGRARGPTRP